MSFQMNQHIVNNDGEVLLPDNMDMYAKEGQKTETTL